MFGFQEMYQIWLVKFLLVIKSKKEFDDDNDEWAVSYPTWKSLVYFIVLYPISITSNRTNQNRKKRGSENGNLWSQVGF